MGYTLWAAAVFAFFSVGWPVAIFLSVYRGGDMWLSGPAHVLVRPYRRHWYGTALLARKLWFAAVLGGFDYQSAATLPTIVFTSLLIGLILQVSAAAAHARAHRGVCRKSHRPNACLVCDLLSCAYAPSSSSTTTTSRRRATSS
jgi:hypothetical protein